MNITYRKSIFQCLVLFKYEYQNHLMSLFYSIKQISSTFYYISNISHKLRQLYKSTNQQQQQQKNIYYHGIPKFERTNHSTAYKEHE